MQTTQNNVTAQTVAAALQQAVNTALQQQNVTVKFTCIASKTHNAVHVKFNATMLNTHCVNAQHIMQNALQTIATQQLNLQNAALLIKSNAMYNANKFAVLFNTVQQQCKKTVAHIKNSAKNMCFATQQQQKKHYLQCLLQALKQNKIAVRSSSATAYSNKTVNVVLRNKAHMQSAIQIAQNVAKQLNLQIHKITAKTVSLHVYCLNNTATQLFNTVCSNKQHTLTHAQVMQVLQKFASNIYVANNYYCIAVASNMQQQTAAALQNALVKHNIAATVTQQAQSFIVHVKNVQAKQITVLRAVSTQAV